MKRRKTFIVKVQRPVETNLPSGQEQCLVYNRDRSLMVTLPMTRELGGAMGDEFKQFWYAHLEGTVLRLDRIAPWREW